ncbi:MAG: chromosome segregation protein SMC [Ruminococcaceae bacterium]|nr:chromosome segregation protein SMC [Oscillospiraceae bacterium]
MYLKSVEMQGFKSFADKIYLDFNPGITAIVGPNGSGKSNISDAIRWVMGEQSVRSLRGSRMEDVIFSGTEVRKPQGFAEVSLVIDNSQHIFPVDYEEVTVTRRVYRSGEGEYFINRNACRLKDIHELFMDTGLGREGYSIVGQGKIDEILSNKSEDRRRIFEEAAGITKYKYRKNEAEKKLERTNDNLTRVTDIMRELEGQLEPLRNQSEKAKKYLNLRDELKGVEVSAAVVTIDKLKCELRETDEQYAAVSESISVMQNDADKTEEQIKGLYEQIAKYDEETEECRETQKNATERTAEENNLITLSLANIEHCKENIERIEEESEKSRRGIEQLDNLIENYSSVLDKLKAEADVISGKKEVLEKSLNEANSLFETSSETVEELKAQIIDKTAEISSLQSKIVNYNILTQNFKAEYENVQAELSKQSGGYDSLVDDNKRVKALFAAKEEEASRAKAEVKALEEKLQAATERDRLLVEKKNQALSELSRCTSKKSVLEDMENDFEGYSRSVKSVMTAHSGGVLKNATIYGPLSNLVTTEKEYVTAIETAMMSVSQNIVTQNEQDAKAAIIYLKQNKLGRATFMPVSTVKGRGVDVSTASKLKGYIAVAKDLVKYDSLYEGVVANVLGATVVVDNIDNAIAMAAKCGHKFRIVTLDGDVMQAGGAMSGGSSGKNSGFLSRKTEIENLTSEIAELRKSLEFIEKEREQNLENLVSAKSDLDRESIAALSINEEYIRLKAEAEHSDRYLAEAEDRRQSLLRDIDTINTRTAEIDGDIVKSKADIERLEQEIVALRGETDGKQTESEEILKSVQDLQEKLLSLTIEENANIKDIELQQERLATVNSERANVSEELAEKTAQIEGFTAKITEISADIEAKRRQLEFLRTETKDIDRRIDELSALRKNADMETRKLQENVKDIHEKLFALGQQKVKVEEKKIKLEQELDGIYTHLWDEYELTYSEAQKLCPDKEINLPEANRIVAELKSKIKALGHINIDAIEEYKNVSERFEFLTAQTQDLEKAKGELEKLIEDMIQIMKKQFSEQFEVISRNFNQVFRELFGGGQATLSLADPDDLLESGVEIEAQPPGKKLQSLTLLSGGERAFTAIALLFAILKVRPTPFCILDEIEAALDDVNVYRYADYLKKFSQKTQFIVVTHRRGTMESANILYGVTMQEKGISKLLSLNIDEVTE